MLAVLLLQQSTTVAEHNASHLCIALFPKLSSQEALKGFLLIGLFVMEVSLAEIALVNMMTYDKHDYNVMGLGNSKHCCCCDRQCSRVGTQTSSEIEELVLEGVGEGPSQTF